MINRFTSFAVLSAAVIALGACGSDSDSDSDSDEPESNVVAAPEATGDLQTHLDALNASIEDQDCETFIKELVSQQRQLPEGQKKGLPEPGAPATEAECDPKQNPVTGPFLADLNGAGAEFEPVAEGDVAAISEAELDKPVRGFDFISTVSVVDRDGEFRLAFNFPADPQSDEPSPEADPAAVVEDSLIPAIQKGDCKGAEKYVDQFSRFAGADAGAEDGSELACKSLLDGDYFAPSVKETPPEEIAVEEIVVARDLAVVGVSTKEAYYALILVTPPADQNKPPQAEFRVSDVLLTTEAEAG